VRAGLEMFKKEQPNKICRWNTPMMRHAAQSVGAVTKIYMKELQSV